MIETVQDLIDVLNKIEDKSLFVRIAGYPIDAIDIVPIMNKVYIWPDYRE